MPIHDELIAFFRTINTNPPTPVSVLTGVSGGADSVALIHLLHQHQKELSIGKLAIAHVNHGLRGEESDGDEAFVKEISAQLKIDFFHTRLADDEPHTGGMEEWARRHRYNFFHQTAKANAFTHIATAHTADDQAETLLLRLARGAGVRGLRGILPARADGVIRPLLNVERRDLEGWLGARGLRHRTDSSNADDRYRRNLIRNRVMPLLAEAHPGALRNMAACAASAARAWEAIAERVEAWTAEYVLRVNADAFHVEKAGLADEAVAPEALLCLFDEHGIPPSRQHIARAMEAAAVSAGEYLMPGGWSLYPRGDRICFVRNGVKSQNLL